MVNSDRWFNLALLPNEEFRDISFAKGGYQISNYGRVKSLKNNKIMKCYRAEIDKYQSNRKNTKGNYYLLVHLSSKKYNINKCFYIHRLVALAFLNNYSEILQVNHINGIKGDNRVENLEMTTASENAKHSYDKLKRDKRKREIIRLNKNREIIEEFECMSDVQRKYGFLVGTICNAIKHNYFSYNSYWKYKEEI